jgi:hypothetical protein
VGDSSLAGRSEPGDDVARAARALLDLEVGPLLVGLRTLEWRWDRLPAAGVDPDEMLQTVADHASAAAKLACELADLAGVDQLAERAVLLFGVVAALADGIVPDPYRAIELARSVTLAADLHDAVESVWRARYRGDASAMSGSANARP